MTEITTVSKNSPRFNSMKTIIPMSIVKQWNLKEGDKLEWVWTVVDGHMLIQLKKAGIK